ncbi:hypothetical protein SAMN05216404_106135 [Nitrosospira multiformis]|uniref:Uncharacterized protein n=1 Tax=Nitrosospira multiformis TaxID=1231 RepID=A0A1H8IPL7_9PROT|nr:hypothetical protein [Nitrosospira multiformis]SEN70359.1 hypothetical protein SAMN05216404_106135 [Nitrosospira multiformis]
MRDFEAPVWVKVAILWALSAFNWVNDNLPILIGWGTLIYTLLQIGVAYKKWRAKPAEKCDG